MKYYVGVGTLKIIRFNPDMAWLNKFKIKATKEPVYVGEKNGVKTAKIVVAFQNMEYNFLTFATFEVRDELLVSKAGKYCFINQFGMTQWKASEEELTSGFFMKGAVYEAIEGEPALMDLFKLWLKGSEDPINFNRSLWFNGQFYELNNRLREANYVGGACTLEITPKSLKSKVYNKKFIPEEQVSKFANQVYGEPYIKKLKEQERNNKTATDKVYFEDWEQLLLSMNSTFYPCQDFFYNGGIKPYVAAENLVLTDDVLIK